MITCPTRQNRFSSTKRSAGRCPAFAHLSTILGSDHTRLSKRHGATSVKNLQDMGILPEALVNYLALLGWAPREGQSEILPLAELIQSFELERVSKSAAVFDLNKLYWINRHYLKAMRPQPVARAYDSVSPTGWTLVRCG